jgi:hypothetical protein
MAITIKECVGIKKQVSEKNGVKRVATTIYYIEPFPENDKDVNGMTVGEIFTYQKFDLKVGDKFKAYYDKGEFWDSAVGKFVDRPVLAEIQVVKPELVK